MPERGHRHQAPGNIVLFGSANDLGIELADLCRKMGKCRDQDLEGGGRIGR